MGFSSVKHENKAKQFMTDELLQLISSKNSSDHREKDNSPVLVNSETNETTLWSYFEFKMAENKWKITPDSTIN